MAIIAIIASLLSGTGLVVQIFTHIRLSKEKKLEAETKRLELEAAKHAKELDAETKQLEARATETNVTGEIAQRLFQRVDALEASKKEVERELHHNKASNEDCERRYRDLAGRFDQTSGQVQKLTRAYNVLNSDHSELKSNHEELKTHVARVESQNDMLRRKIQSFIPGHHSHDLVDDYEREHAHVDDTVYVDTVIPQAPHLPKLSRPIVSVPSVSFNLRDPKKR